MSTSINHPPALSTPSYISISQPQTHLPSTSEQHHVGTDVNILYILYEIDRTVSEIRRGKWRRIALQFPDEMLADAPFVCKALGIGLAAGETPGISSSPQINSKIKTRIENAAESATEHMRLVPQPTDIKLYILGDTSYGACCVDEIAAQHVDADVVVHYGRACLSPTARLPVIYVFTVQPLAVESVVGAFQENFREMRERVILMADVSYTHHIPHLTKALCLLGYTQLHATNVIHDPSSPLPNRTVPEEVHQDPTKLKNWSIFHVSQPSDSLLLILSSRVSQLHVFSTSKTPSTLPNSSLSTESALRRRYALVTSVSSASIFGILVNTLSVKSYLDVVERVKRQIIAAGRKYYTMVVGKVNAAKMANFSEVAGWVVIGCWESSLIDSKDFWKPVITPFELDLALRRADDRMWTGKWISDFQSVLGEPETTTILDNVDSVSHRTSTRDEICAHSSESEAESSPPEFDLRTGQYVPRSRPPQPFVRFSSPSSTSNSLEPIINDRAMVKRHITDLARIGGAMSPGAEFLRSNRTWTGLGSDFEITYEDLDIPLGAAIEEGRNGIARGYTLGSETSRT